MCACLKKVGIKNKKRSRKRGKTRELVEKQQRRASDLYSQILRVGQSSPSSRRRVLIGCGKVKLKPR